MVVADVRRNFIVSTAGHFFGISIKEESGSDENLVLEKFLNQPTCRTLCAHPADVQNHLKLSNELPVGKNTLVFFKITDSTVSEDNFHDIVQVTSTGKNGGSSLVEALRQVWAPTLKSSGVDAVVLKKLENELLGPKSVSSIEEEETYWKKKAARSKKPEDKKLYEQAAGYLKDIKREFDNASASRDGLFGVEEALDSVSGLIDDLWKLKDSIYTEERMSTLLDIIGNLVVKLVESFIEKDKAAGDRLQVQSIAISADNCEKWVTSCEKLTSLFWPHHSLHPWKGPKYTPNKCVMFGKRLREIADLRAQNRQLTRLLTTNERSSLGTDGLFQLFDDLQGLAEDDKDIEWERLKRKIEDGLVPAEERVAGKLKAQIAGAKTPTALEAEFRRYYELMKRDNIKNALRIERESLLVAYKALIVSYQIGPDTEELLDNPQILQNVQAARVSELKLESLSKLGNLVLTDLSGYDEIATKISAAVKDAEKHRQHLVDSWVNEMSEAVSTKELTLGTDSAVVELTGASLMRVTFDPRLITLIREARALAGNGVELPREIRNLVERASALAGRARALEQIANFHNTIGDRMVPSQRPLMLTAALELARAVREQSGVAWSDPQAVDAYTNRLRELVRKFARQNADLAAKHASLRDLVSNLMKGDTINLVRNQNAWKDTLKNMRAIVDQVETEYGNTKAWKLHWDRQLLKALGIAFRAALPSLLRKLPEIRVELMFRDGSLQWRPPLEEIRAKLYSSIRRFLAIPVNFRGVGDQADNHFQSLVNRSAYLFGGVYKEAEIALDALETVRNKWIPLAALAKFDTGQGLKGKQALDWERSFKEAKQWAQEVGKLKGSEVKIWCIIVDTGTTRNDLETVSRRYWDRMCSDLRSEVSSRLVAIVEFLNTASKELNRRPYTVEEIGEAYEAYNRIQEQATGMSEELQAVSALARVLAIWTREKLDGVSSAHAAWESLSERLESHKDLMSQQLEDAKVNLRHRGLALRDERERWEAKWATKPDVVTLEWIAIVRDKWNTLSDQRDTIVIDCKRLGIPVDDILEGDDEFVARSEGQMQEEELNCRFQTEFLDELKKHEEEEWSVARRRLPRLHDWLDSWEARMGAHLRANGTSPEEKIEVKSYSFIGKKIMELRKSIDWIQLLRGDDLADEHWNELKEILNLKDVKRMNEIKLGHLLMSAEQIEKHADKVKEVTARAAAESGIRQALAELEAWEGSTSLPVQEARDSKNIKVYLVGDYSALLARAGELRLLLEGAKGASGYERFAARASRCEAAIYELEERIKILSVVQRKWIYLEPVYGGGAAPSDSGRWLRADKEFRYIMNEIIRDPRVPSLRRLPYPSLTSLKDLLDRCQRSLDEYLEEKRSAYPRLYFLSDEDLLELVSGKGKGLETHLSKLFQGVASIERNDDLLTMVISPEGEKLQLPEPINLTEPLSQWLSNLEKGMRVALQTSLEKCINDTSPDPSVYPAQILLLSERIRFTERCENAIKHGATELQNLLVFLETQRARYRGLEDIGDTLTSLKARSLLLDTVYHLQVTRNLLSVASDREKMSWTWNRQLRNYKKNKGIIVRSAGAEFPYCFEYQGAAIGLVRTPLTERCFLALTQAMKLGLGGSPTGPAGTGKTESVKALASLLGRLVLVFNCDEGMDSTSMRRILGGLAQAGAWGCFDEFNRLEEETLSAVGMLVRPLQEAIRDGTPTVNFGEQSVPVDPHCCIFITMNPASNDYGGRRKLPDSLARLFRPIGMAHPNKNNIVGALLECAGFSDAATLAKQLVEIFEISEKLLSKQAHYDWGLRALRSVLDAIPITIESDGDAETSRLIAGIYASTLPKLTKEDTTTFTALVSDAFPKGHSTLPPSKEMESLRSALKEVCEVNGIQNDVAERCVQLRDQLQSRTGVAIVGPPGSGKSLIRKLLAEALAKIGEPVIQYLIYPGAVPRSKLLGKVDSRTREFKEGLLSTAIFSADNGPLWIVLNGDVEPDWAEALNSALDDNRILTLPNGVGIKLGEGMKFIFETHKLMGASPATVSRLGIVHLGSTSPNALLNKQSLQNLPPVADNTVNAHLCSIIDQVLKDKGEHASAAGLIEMSAIHLQNARTPTLCAHALLTALCGQVEDTKARDDLARLIYQATDTRCPDPQVPNDILYNEDIDRLEPFGDHNKSTATDDGPVYLSGMMQKGLATVLPWITAGQSVMLRGPLGCGRNSLTSVAMSSLKIESGISPLVIRESSLYGTQDLIARLKTSCIKVDSSSHGRLYKPKTGSSLILILEDIHLASKDLQELVRQLIQEGGFHEDDLEFARISLTVLSTADSSTKIHPRLDALLATHHLTKQGIKDLEAIAELHLNNSLQSENRLILSWIARMTSTVVGAFKTVCIDESSEIWTPKDLIRWLNTLKYYPLAENESEITTHLLDASRRLFISKLSVKERGKLENMIASQEAAGSKPNDDVYVWKGGNTGLLPLGGNQWKEEIENAATRCAREGDPVQAQFSSHLLQTAAGLSWALGCQQRGIILIGRPGAGRKTATKLISTITNNRLVDSGQGRGKASVKIAVQAAGIDGEPTMLLLEEHHLREEGFAILASAIVSRGELPGLFSPEELDSFVAPLSDLSRREDFSGSLEQYFYHRLRNFLRVTVILDANEAKKAWLSRSSLPRHCVTIGQGRGNEWWFAESSLKQLAMRENDELDPNVEESQGVKELVNGHLSAPIQQQAPARFLALIHTWKQLRENWLREIESKLKNLEAGISRLKEAGDQVAKLEEEASKQRQDLEIEKGRANAALEQISATMRGATGQRGEMTTLKANTEKESTVLARRKADIETELGKVEPLVEQAAQAVAGIGADALAEVRSLRAPPTPVRDVLEGVLRLMGIRDTSWNSMKTFLAKRGVKDEIRNWDARRSTAASLEAVAKLIKERPESFEEKTARRASVAAAPLAAWVLANLQYGQILQQVAPLEREQRILAERLSAAEAQIGKLEAGLNSVESRVAQLQEELAAHSRGAAELQLRSEATEASLATARALLSKLDAEHNDWQSQCESLTTRKNTLDTEAANAACLLVYQDPSRSDKWRKAAIDLLTSDRERLQWRAQGLPADTDSLIGAARALRGPLVPIFLDSSGIAVSWLRSNLGSKLEVTKPEDAKFHTTVELAIRFGKPLLVEDIIALPPILLPLLRRRPLRLGDRTLPAQVGFQLFLATRSEYLEGMPSEADAVLIKLSLGSGTKSLAERLVQKAILKETPELETQRRETLEKEEQLSGERDAARLELLVQLGNARGQDLLQESQGQQGGLLATLEITQSKAKAIAVAINESRKGLEDIIKRSAEHDKLAKFSAGFYKAVKSLTSLSPLYVFTAEAIAGIYLETENGRSALKDEEKKDQDRLLEKNFIVHTLHHCTKAAYRKHRLPLALHLALSLNPVSDDQRNLLLGGESLNVEGTSGYKVPGYIPQERKSAVRALATSLPQVASKLNTSWLEDIGNIYAENGLSQFEKILVIQALRPDCLHTALSKYAADQLGVAHLTPPSWSLRQIAEENTEYPVLLLLSPGADPEPEIRSLANDRVVSATGFTEVSLGQGHIAQAEAALATACKNGSWLLLSNLQLALNWLPRLEGFLRSPMCTTEKSPSTRIWLTTEECTGFYAGLAGLCLKLAYEPPEGVKRNVKRSLQQLQHRQPSLDITKTLLLSWLHAVLQERRRFVPQGWIKAYAWSEADLEAACELVVNREKNENSKSEDWEAGRGLLDVAVYGGLLQDDYDMRALKAILMEIWSKQVFLGQRKLGGVLNLPKVAASKPDTAIDRLSDIDSPQEYFGLPANANRTWEKSAADAALRLLKETTRKTASRKKDKNTGKTATSVQNMTKDLKNLIDQRLSDSAFTKEESDASSDPLNRFFMGERNTAKQLLKQVRLDLENRRLDDIKTSNKATNDGSSGPQEIIPYVNRLLSRHQALSSLNGLPRTVELSWFERPQAFLAALKQHTARELACPFESLRLRANWTEETREMQWRMSVVLDGLLLTGATIESGSLKEVTAESIPVTTAPGCQIAYIVQEPGDEQKLENIYGDSIALENDDDTLDIPVYKDSLRSHFICALPIGCPKEEQLNWLRRGIGFHLQSN